MPRAASCSPSTSSPCLSTTPAPTARPSRCSRARSPTPTGATGRCSSSCRAARAARSPRPTRHPSSPGWLDRALTDFRVLMLDQRGTGRSTPIGTLPGLSAAEQAEYLTHFRADAIVRDAEHIRQRAGRRALERARPELRRAVRHDLPVDRPRGAARGVRHRRPGADRAAHRGRLPRDLLAHARALPALLRALPRRPRAGARAARPPRARRRPPALGRPAHRAGGCASSATCWA